MHPACKKAVLLFCKSSVLEAVVEENQGETANPGEAVYPQFFPVNMCLVWCLLDNMKVNDLISWLSCDRVCRILTGWTMLQ